MTPLRHKMIEAMQQRGFSVRTHRSYLSAVSELARYYHRSPERLDVRALQGFFRHLAVERQLSGATCRLYLNAIRFLYLQVLAWRSFDVSIQVPKRAQRIPELLTREEVGRILGACRNGKHRMLLTTCYGCGLRVSEVVSLRVRHIDGERRVLRIEQGKGAKDRYVPLSPALLEGLRGYWRLYRPAIWLFAGSDPSRALSIHSAQKCFQAAKRRAGVEKIGGIHGLRHAYATHQLEAGLAVHRLQHLLGHRNIRSTLRYVHWVPSCGEGAETADLIAGLEVGDD